MRVGQQLSPSLPISLYPSTMAILNILDNSLILIIIKFLKPKINALV